MSPTIEAFTATLGGDGSPPEMLPAEAANGALPSYAFIGKLKREGRAVQKAGVSSEGEPIAAGTNLNVCGFGTDPDVVLKPGGGFRMVFNSPHWNPALKRYPTAIWGTESDDGINWSTPIPVLTPVLTAGQQQPVQFETPSLRYDETAGRWLLAVTEYQYEAGNRSDSVSLWRAEDWSGPYERVGTPLSPVHPWEAPWQNQQGKLTGGCQEPALMPKRCGWLVTPYGGVTYANGQKPSIGIAGSPDDGATWLRLSTPIITSNGKGLGAGQPDWALDPRGGVHWFWQTRTPPATEGGRPIYRVHHGFSHHDLTRVYLNPNNPVLENDDPNAWDSGRITATGVVIEMREGKAVFHGHYFGGKNIAGTSPCGSGTEQWIGYATYSE